MEISKIKRKLEYKLRRSCLDMIEYFEASDSENLLILVKIMRNTIYNIRKYIK